jgi:glyoxylase-like metal-dependent hydrolase (beta-lactamase superfamily II)
MPAYTLHALDTGRFRLDGGAMFGVVPRPLWERRLAPDDRNRIPLAMRCLLLEGADRLVLVDAGLGHKYDARFQDLYAVDHETATLERSLRAAGFGPGDVTDVVLTHLHFDHGGGVTRRDGDRLALTFPGARHHVQRRHWEWAKSPNAREKASFFAENLDPLQAEGVLVLHDGPGEILPGVRVRTFDGHTEAQQVVLVDGPGGPVAFVADLLPTSHHLGAAWTMGYDVRPLVTMDEKAAFLEEAARDGIALFFEHDPDVELASVVCTERGPQVTDVRRVGA